MVEINYTYYLATIYGRENRFNMTWIFVPSDIRPPTSDFDTTPSTTIYILFNTVLLLHNAYTIEI